MSDSVGCRFDTDCRQRRWRSRTMRMNEWLRVNSRIAWQEWRSMCNSLASSKCQNRKMRMRCSHKIVDVLQFPYYYLWLSIIECHLDTNVVQSNKSYLKNGVHVVIVNRTTINRLDKDRVHRRPNVTSDNDWRMAKSPAKRHMAIFCVNRWLRCINGTWLIAIDNPPRFEVNFAILKQTNNKSDKKRPHSTQCPTLKMKPISGNPTAVTRQPTKSDNQIEDPITIVVDSMQQNYSFDATLQSKLSDAGPDETIWHFTLVNGWNHRASSNAKSSSCWCCSPVTTVIVYMTVMLFVIVAGFVYYTQTECECSVARSIPAIQLTTHSSTDAIEAEES